MKLDGRKHVITSVPSFIKMYLYTISLLLFSNLFIEISTSEPTTSTQNPTRKFNHDQDNCVCFPGGPSLIPELISHQGHGLERLVVYLYRDVNTNLIKLFIPSPEKQVLIPNIPFAIGDVLKTVTTETVASLIQPNPNSIGRDHPQTDAVPIGLKWGTIEQASPAPTYVDILQGPQNNPQHIQPRQINSQQIPAPSNLIYSDKKQPSWYNNQIYNPPNGQPQHGIVAGAQNIYSWDPIRKKYDYAFNPYQPNNPLGPYQINVTPPLPIGANKQDIFAPGTVSHGITFDQWFNRQMELFREANSPQDIQAINTGVLRSLIQKALFENHMHIGSTGQITDANGVPIDLNNLELRPILIGNSVKYPLVKTKQHLTLPKHLPYLEGILITLVYPPKVLGVIPLGKTYVSQSGLDASLTTPKARIYYTGTGSDANLGPSSSLLSSYSTVSGAPPSLISSYSTVSGAPPSLISSYSTVSGAPPVFLGPSSSVTSPPYSHLNPYSSVTNSQYPNSQWYSNGGSTSPNVYQNSKITPGLERRFYGPNLLYSSVNVPFYSGAEVPYLTLQNPFKTDVLWGPQFNNYWQRRSNKSNKQPKSPRNPKPPKSNNRQSSKATNSKSPKSNKQSRSFDSYIPDYVENNPPDSNSNNRRGSFPGNFDSSHHPNQNSFARSKPNQLSVIPLNPSSGSNVEYYPTSNTFSQSNPDSTKLRLTAMPDPYSSSNLNYQSQNSWNPVPYTNSYGSSQSKIRNGPNVSNLDSPSWPPIKVRPKPFRNPNLRSEPDPKDVKPVESSTGITYPFITSTETIQQQNKSLTGQTRRFSMSSMQGVIKTLINLVLQNLSHVGESRRKDVETNVTVPNHLDKTGEDGDRPDFRIIGGSAATGSGSPLSNKGRSGIIR